LAVPLVLRDKVAAILYCDSTQDDVPAATADVVEIMVAFAAKVIDVLSGAAKAAAAPGGTSPGMRPAAPVEPAADSPASGINRLGGTGTMRPVAAPPLRPAPPLAQAPSLAPPPASAPPARPSTSPPLRPAFTPPPPPVMAPAPARSALSAEDQKAHEDAKRFARLVVSEIKLYNEAKVNEGRRQKDIYERLKEDIERGRQMYTDRVAAPVRDATNYFYDELVRILAGGDASVLGPM
jgi:hypothetical protein